jgi:hypothetical protein
MQINVKVITKSKQNKIKQEKEGLKIYLTAVPEKGKANELLLKLLADYYKINKSRIKIIKGEKSKNKIVKID